MAGVGGRLAADLHDQSRKASLPPEARTPAGLELWTRARQGWDAAGPGAPGAGTVSGGAGRSPVHCSQVAICSNAHPGGLGTQSAEPGASLGSPVGGPQDGVEGNVRRGCLLIPEAILPPLCQTLGPVR